MAREPQTSSANKPEEGRYDREEIKELSTIDMALMQSVIEGLYELEQSANTRVSIIRKGIGMLTWAFLEFFALVSGGGE